MSLENLVIGQYFTYFLKWKNIPAVNKRVIMSPKEFDKNLSWNNKGELI